jgi:hypothetical protein
MSDPLDELLDECLAARSDGRSPPVGLKTVEPAQRLELETLVALADRIREAPRASLSAAASNRLERNLLARAAELRASSHSVSNLNGAAPRVVQLPVLSTSQVRGDHKAWALGSFLHWRPGLVPAASFFLVIASFVLLGSTGAAVSNARPDESLYSVKLSFEQAQLLLSVNDLQRAQVFLRIAQSRLRELEELARDGQPIPDELMLHLKLSVNQAILLASNLTGRDGIPLLRQLADLLALERRLLAGYVVSLPAAEQPSVQVLIQEVMESQSLVDQTLQQRLQEHGPESRSEPTPIPSSQASAEVEPDAQPGLSAIPAALAPRRVNGAVELPDGPSGGATHVQGFVEERTSTEVSAQGMDGSPDPTAASIQLAPPAGDWSQPGASPKNERQLISDDQQPAHENDAGRRARGSGGSSPATSIAGAGRAPGESNARVGMHDGNDLTSGDSSTTRSENSANRGNESEHSDTQSGSRTPPGQEKKSGSESTGGPNSGLSSSSSDADALDVRTDEMSGNDRGNGQSTSAGHKDLGATPDDEEDEKLSVSDDAHNSGSSDRSNSSQGNGDDQRSNPDGTGQGDNGLTQAIPRVDIGFGANDSGSTDDDRSGSELGPESPQGGGGSQQRDRAVGQGGQKSDSSSKKDSPPPRRGSGRH